MWHCMHMGVSQAFVVGVLTQFGGSIVFSSANFFAVTGGLFLVQKLCEVETALGEYEAMSAERKRVCVCVCVHVLDIVG